MPESSEVLSASRWQRLRRFLLGAPLDPLDLDARKHAALIAFLAWVGLGADGLSSACYGPEEAFVALGVHTHMGLYLALATAITVFVIALAYNQVIELFPSGGGGYKVATKLLGARAGLVSGAALLVDYVLTIAISVASAMDAAFSLLSHHLQVFKIGSEIVLILVLIGLNLRGMKESIAVLLPLFLGFVISHAFLILYGSWLHHDALGSLWQNAHHSAFELSAQSGWMFVAALFLRAYSLGGGTYTGLEAVSNNVNMLAEPRVRTGRLAMLMMAFSLAFTAGGIILLYLLWGAHRVEGQTLNAVVFQSIIGQLPFTTPSVQHGLLIATLALEAGLLLVAANTGFLGGPAVLANMAVDSWVPRQFRNLSVRLVTQDGVLVMGITALVVLLLTDGRVDLLVVLYSINVFLTFSLSLAGLTKHWWQDRRDTPNWRRKLAISLLGLSVTSGILVVTVVEKLGSGGWLTILITSIVIALCLRVRAHYDGVREKLRLLEKRLAPPLVEEESEKPPPKPNPKARTAVLLVGKDRGMAMYALQWIQQSFPGQFKNFLFLSAGELDSGSYYAEIQLQLLKDRLENTLSYFIRYCARQGLAAKSYAGYGTDPVDELEKLTAQAMADFPDSVCFACKLLFRRDNWLMRLLHNQTPQAVQRRMQLRELPMVVIPLGLDEAVPPAVVKERKAQR